MKHSHDGRDSFDVGEENDKLAEKPLEVMQCEERKGKNRARVEEGRMVGGKRRSEEAGTAIGKNCSRTCLLESLSDGSFHLRPIHAQRAGAALPALQNICSGIGDLEIQQNTDSSFIWPFFRSDPTSFSKYALHQHCDDRCVPDKLKCMDNHRD